MKTKLVKSTSLDLAVAGIIDMAHRVLGSRELAEWWLRQPAIALDGQTPRSLLLSARGIEQVSKLLTRIEYGVYV